MKDFMDDGWLFSNQCSVNGTTAGRFLFDLRLADVGIVSDCHRCNYAATYVLEISDTQILLEKKGKPNDLKLLVKQHPSHPNHIHPTTVLPI